MFEVIFTEAMDNRLAVENCLMGVRGISVGDMNAWLEA